MSYKKSIYLLLTIFIIGVTAMSHSEVSWENTEFGDFVIVETQYGPYPHESRKDGYTTSGGKFYPMEEHYNDPSTGIFIPKGYKPGKKIDLMIHFHGHGNNVAKEIDKFDFRQMVSGSGKNVIMILPQGPKDAGDSSCGKLEEPGGFERYIKEVMGILKDLDRIRPDSEIGKIILSGHSGGYKVIAKILKHGGLPKHIKEVFLFDATYDLLDEYTDWTEKKRGRLISIFTSHLGGENVYIITNLLRDRVRFKLAKDTLITEQHLRRYKAIFMLSELGHSEVMSKSKHMQTWLETSCLRDIPKSTRVYIKTNPRYISDR